MANNGDEFAHQGDPIMIDLDDDSDQSDWTILDELVSSKEIPRNPIDLTRPELSASLRNMPSCRHNGFNLQVTNTVELDDGDFLLIKHISQRHGTHEIFLEGHIFRRAYKLEGLLEKKKNEVVWIQRYNPNKEGDIYRQSLQHVEIRRVIAKRDMVLTNYTYPIGSYRDELVNMRLDNSAILQRCRLACRWKYLSNGDKEGSLVMLEQNETDAWYKIVSSRLRDSWRGSSVIGGSCTEWLPGEKDFDRAERRRCNDLDPLGLRRCNDPLEEPGQRYTFGDAFCGAGGVSRGAKAAGLRVLWGFDYNKAAIDSYRLNFYGTDLFCTPADIFATANPEEVKVDILHLSPSCQPFSPAHVRTGQDDDANEATLFALGGILMKTKPRVVMVEETFGLLRTAYRMQWFRAMIQVFTKMGFSVRWKIFNLIEYGLPGRRQRLFIFASCPGEPLPDFPLPTHCSPEYRTTKPHLSHYRTINDAIDPIPTTCSIHNDSNSCNEPAYDGNVPLPNTICCNINASKHPSSRMIHPSGRRTFTSRELASLNGFPPEHEFGQFGKTELRKQIGNAVPPVVVKLFFEQIVKSLRRADGL